MIKHYLNYAETAIKNYWSFPAFTNYGKNTFTFGQVAENIEKLFGTRLTALGPETRPDAAGHDDAVLVVFHKRMMVFMLLLSTNITLFSRKRKK